MQGTAHYTLALASRGTRAAERTVPLLRHAADDIDPSLTRFRGHFLPDLAGAHALSSLRAYERLRTLHAALKPLHASAGVAELRARMAATAA